MSEPVLLFTPLTVRGVTLTNRVMVSPMCTYSSGPNGLATDFHLVHAGRFALGGAGLVVLEATAVEARGRISDRDLGLWNDGHIAPLARIARFLQDNGAVAGIQLGHAGRRGNSPPPWEAWFPHPGAAADPWPVVAPSAEPALPQAAVPIELSDAEIDATIANWAAAARRASQAGFQWIEVHCAHGYLMHTFLSPLSNHRSDAYGGSWQNRLRYPLEVASAIRAAIDEDIVLAYRISAVDGTPDGLQIEDSEEFVKQLLSRGVDVIDTSSGGIRTGSADPTKVRRGFAFHAPYSARIKRATGAVVATVGLIVDGLQAEAILQAGDADIVALGREMLVEPNWAHIAEGQLTERGYREWPRQFGWWLDARQRTLDGLRAEGEAPLSRYGDPAVTGAGKGT